MSTPPSTASRGLVTGYEPAQETTTTTHELRSSGFATGLTWLYAALRGPGAALCRRLIRRLITRLEGGEMQSASLRVIMRRCHGVDAGAHAYGCFDPVRFPRGTRIGRYASIGPGVAAYRRNHPLERLSLHPYFYRPDHGATDAADVLTSPLDIGADAWLGANTLILPGCRRIGRGAVVAAGAVVTKDVPAYAVVGGNPARLIRYRFGPEEIRAAEQTRWWLSAPDEARRRHETSRPWSEVFTSAASRNGA